MRLVDTEHPFFQPAWRRYCLVAFCAAWTGVELWFGNTGWAAFIGAISLYLVWILILRFPGQTDAD